MGPDRSSDDLSVLEDTWFFMTSISLKSQSFPLNSYVSDEIFRGQSLRFAILFRTVADHDPRGPYSRFFTGPINPMYNHIRKHIGPAVDTGLSNLA